MRHAIVFGILSLAGTTASGQTLVSANSSLNASGQAVYNATFSFRQEPFTDPYVKQAPYVADEVLDRVGVQADGRRFEQSSLVRKLYRDALGRVRVEKRLPMGPAIPEGPSIVEITDPAAGMRYILDPEKKIAHRSQLLRSGEKRQVFKSFEPQMSSATWTPIAPATVNPGGNSVTAAPAQESPELEDEKEPAVAVLSPASAARPAGEPLGSRVIDGVSSLGTRYEYRPPEAFSVDRKPPSTELWVSWDLQLTLISKLISSDGGETTTSLKNIHLAEADPALFQVPADYRLQDEPTSFQIQFQFVK